MPISNEITAEGPLQTILKITKENSWQIDGETWKKTYTVIGTSSYWTIKISSHIFGGTTKRQSIKIEKCVIHEFIDNLQRIELSIPANFPSGCDGSFTELKIGDYFGGLKLRWWSVPPPCWEKIDALINELITLINNHKSNSNKRN